MSVGPTPSHSQRNPALFRSWSGLMVGETGCERREGRGPVLLEAGLVPVWDPMWNGVPIARTPIKISPMTHPDFRMHLRRQIEFLRRSVQIYDNGGQNEAIRIAVVLRVIFHDTGNSISLLTHLGIKRSVEMLTTIPNAYEEIPGTNRARVMLTPPISPENGFVPPLERAERRDLVAADAWWNQAVLWRGAPITRGDVVLSAANEDGGAHVRANPREKARQLLAGVGTYRPAGAEQEIPLDKVHYPLLRQFAYEVLESDLLSL